MKYNDYNSKIFLGFAAGAIAGISLAAFLLSEKQPDIKKKISDSLDKLGELVNDLFQGRDRNTAAFDRSTPKAKVSQTNIHPENQAVS